MGSRRWDELTIANDFVFCKAMLNESLCCDVLEAILGVPVEHIEYAGRQTVLDASPDAKAVRLDVYVRDETQAVYDVEMQMTDTHELPQRTHYYHALMALDQIQRGEEYRDLKKAYAIFICGFDPFGHGHRVYCFENTCQSAGSLVLGDGAQTIFLAAPAPSSVAQSDRLNELLDFVDQGRVTGKLSARLQAEVTAVLDDEKWRLEYMHLEVRDQLNRNEGRAEGIACGEARLAALLQALMAQDRMDDARDAVNDPVRREELYRELNGAVP